MAGRGAGVLGAGAAQRPAEDLTASTVPPMHASLAVGAQWTVAPARSALPTKVSRYL